MWVSPCLSCSPSFVHFHHIGALTWPHLLLSFTFINPTYPILICQRVSNLPGRVYPYRMLHPSRSSSMPCPDLDSGRILRLASSTFACFTPLCPKVSFDVINFFYARHPFSDIFTFPLSFKFIPQTTISFDTLMQDPLVFIFLLRTFPRRSYLPGIITPFSHIHSSLVLGL